MSDYSLTIRDQEAFKGPANAPLTLIEYGDYECPFSRMGYRFVQRILKSHPEEIRFVFRHFPITSKHPHAQMCAEAALCANSQNQFWGMHDLMFDNSLKLNREILDEFATQLDLDLRTFSVDLETRHFKAWVQTDYRSGIKHGVDDTPTFFVNEEKYTGELDLNELKAFIEDHL